MHRSSVRWELTGTVKTVVFILLVNGGLLQW
jgi:hypothetical protein